MNWKLATTALLVAWLGMVQGADFTVGERLKPGTAAPTKQDAKEIDWEALVPADWNPQSRLKALKLDELSDNDPRAMEALAQLRAELDHAPVVQKLAWNSRENSGLPRRLRVWQGRRHRIPARALLRRLHPRAAPSC